MNLSYRAMAVTCGGFALALSLVPSVAAQCGGIAKPLAKPSSFGSQAGGARLMSATYMPESERVATLERVDDEEAAIVGFWHVKFVSFGSAAIPDGTEFDAGYSQWHSDHTEILNSARRSPITSNYCLGVWKQVGTRQYKLNHYGAGWDATGAHLIGTGHIQEQVTLSRDGNRFAGRFQIDQLDEAGHVLVHLQGNVTGTRITVDTPPSSIF